MAFRLPAVFSRIGLRRRGGRATPEKASSKPLLAPRWLVSIDADFNTQAYRISLHWSGRRTLVSGALPAGEACYLVLHPALPFRRKLQRFPVQAKAREVLLRTAPDEFPLAQGAVSYCLGLREGEGYVYALPGEINDRLLEAGLRPDIVLVGGSQGLDAADCLATLGAYEQFGPTLSFGSRRRPLPRHWLLDLPLAVGAALALGLMVWLAAGADPFAEVLGKEQARLRRETAGVAEQYAAAENMLAARSHLARLRETPGAKLPLELDNLWQGIPPGQAIRRIEYKEGHLTLIGSGVEVGKWLESAGFAPDKITTETVGKLHRFRAEKVLAP
jgi:hypothetical protein